MTQFEKFYCTHKAACRQVAQLGKTLIESAQRSYDPKFLDKLQEFKDAEIEGSARIRAAFDFGIIAMEQAPCFMDEVRDAARAASVNDEVRTQEDAVRLPEFGFSS